MLRKNFSTELEKPQPKQVKKFNPQRYEIRMQDIIDRETPLLQLSLDKAERPPFLEQVFQKNFDERFLTYPEVLEPNQVDDMHAMYRRVKSYVDSLPPDCMDNGPPAEVMQGLKSLSLFQIFLPYSYRGLEQTMTEMSRIMEAFAALPSLALIVATHNVAGIRTLINHGTDEQRVKYLPQLTDGKPVVAYAIDEETDVRDSKTTATLDGDECILNGKKIFVKNGQNAEVIVVVCDFQGDGETGRGALLVDRKLEGVLLESSPKTYGLKGSGLSTVHFRNVRVPRDCVLGSVGQRSKVAESIAANMRVALSAAAIGPCRDAFDQAFKYTYCNERFGQLICSFELVKEQITQMAMDVFTMESCVYFSTAIEDVVIDPNLKMESIATAVTCHEAAQRMLNQSADTFGASGKYLSHNSTRWLDEIVTSPFLFASSPREQSLFLAQNGLRGVVEKLAAKKARGRELAPIMTAIKTTPLEDVPKRLLKDTPERKGTLQQFLHPSLFKSANILDYCQRNFGSACERLVEKFGEDAINNDIILDHITRLTLDIFTLSQNLSRSSRSYCIGLFNGYEEIKLASVHGRIVLPAFESRLKVLNAIIEHGTLPGESVPASYILASRKYPIPHPTRKLGSNK